MANDQSAAVGASPFLDIPSFKPVESEVVSISRDALKTSSPFKSVYRTDEIGETVDPETEEVYEFLFELHDQDFEDALLEVASEFRDLLGTHEAGGMSPVARQRMLHDYLAPVTFEMERLVDSLADAADARGTAFQENEIDGAIDDFTPETELSPTFEHLFGGWKKKLKKLAKKGLNLAKKGLKAAATLGLGAILRRLKGHLVKLLIAVLKRAIGKLPAYLRPVARQLYKRYAGKYLREVEFEAEDGEAAVADPAEIELEFDQYLTYYVYADQELEQDELLAEMDVEGATWSDGPMPELDQARDRFIEELSALKADEDPQPSVDRFLPAILPILKAGVELGGRKRIVDSLGKQLAKLIRRFVGRRYAKPLARAVVDLGLRYSGLEVSDEDSHHAGAEAVAYTVEDTVRRLAQLPETALANHEALEAEVVSAFETAATAYLPDVLQEEVYAARPELREACAQPVFWVGMPLRGPRRVYRKLAGDVGDVAVCPHSLQRIRTWRGQTLASHLRTRMGVNVGRSLPARMQFYEVMLGGSLQDIARIDPDLQIAGRVPSWLLLHPLTREAAGLMLGEPGLGRDFPTRYLDHPARSPAVGQRFYYIHISATAPQIMATTGRPAALRRPSEVTLILDLIRNRIGVEIYLSESRAQEIASILRGNTHHAAVAMSLRSVVEPGLRAALCDGMHNRVRLLHTAVAPEYSDGRALDWLPVMVLRQLARALSEWVERCLSGTLGQETQAFVSATEADADGVTLCLYFVHPPGLSKIRSALAGEPIRLREPWFPKGSPHATLRSFAGVTRS